MPIRHHHETTSPLPPEALFDATLDFARWPDWDPGLEWVRLGEGPVVPGHRFALKPKDGPKVAMTLEAAERPYRLVDLAHLPLAVIRTFHEFEPDRRGSRVRVTIETSGPLAFLWDRILARKLIQDTEPQLQRLTAHLRASQPASVA